MLHGESERDGCTKRPRYLYFDEATQLETRRRDFPKEDEPQQGIPTFTCEEDFIEQRPNFVMQFRRPVLFDGYGGTAILHTPVRTMGPPTTWSNYLKNKKETEEFRLLVEEACQNSHLSSSDSDSLCLSDSDSESSPFDPVDASAAGLNHSVSSPADGDDDGKSDSESLPFDLVDASAAGLDDPLLEEKPELVLSSAPLDTLDDVTHKSQH